jgi:hypothetical protein
MTDDESSGTSLLSALFTVIFFGVITTSIVGFMLATTTEVRFDLNILYEILANTSDVVSYGALVLGFGIAGLIAGVRTKSAEKGFLAGFFGSFLSGLLAFILATLDEFVLALETTDFSSYGEIVPPKVKKTPKIKNKKLGQIQNVEVH